MERISCPVILSKLLMVSIGSKMDREEKWMSRSLYASGTSGFVVFIIEPSCTFSTCRACVGISHSISIYGVAKALDGRTF